MTYEKNPRNMSIPPSPVRRRFRAREEPHARTKTKENANDHRNLECAWIRPNERRTGTAIGATTRTTHQRKATVGIWIGRVMSGLVIAFLLMASVFPKLFMPELAKNRCSSWVGMRSTCGHRRHRARRHAPLRRPAHGGLGRRSSDWPSRGRGRNPPSDRESIVQSHLVSALRWFFHVGRALAAQRSGASALAALHF